MATPDEIRRVRTLIPDKEAVFGPNEDETMFSDEEVEDFLFVGGGNLKRAAAYANTAIATSEALISKVIRTQDLQTNGAQVADALLKKADRLFDEADKEDAQTNMDFFQIIDFREGWRAERPELTEWSV